MAEFHPVCRVGEIPEGQGKVVCVGKKIIAVFCENGEYHAIDDMCPHMGASLGSGAVENGVVTCPWHAWHFRIKDGTWADNPRIRIASYATRVEGDQVLVADEPTPLPPPPRPQPRRS